jgi:hypothetical protein
VQLHGRVAKENPGATNVAVGGLRFRAEDRRAKRSGRIGREDIYK